MKTKKEIRLGNLLERRDTLHRMSEELVSSIELSDSKIASEEQRETLARYRSELEAFDLEIEQLAGDIESDRKALERSRSLKTILSTSADGVTVEDDGIVYRDFYTYARDVVLTRTGREFASIAGQFSRDELADANERVSLLHRVNNTLSSNVGGLTPAQHIAQIFQVINASRPMVDSALRSTLERGSLTYPKVTSSPVVAVQASEKTEAGNTGLVVAMETATASTYLGGGDLSWQAINWSSPDALQLWFNLAAADYALKTESDAGQVVTDSAFVNIISNELSGTLSFDDFLTAVADGAAAVYAASGRQANTLYVAEDAFWTVFGLTSDAFAQFATVSQGNIGPMSIVRTRGLASGCMIVGDSAGLLVAETAGAPVELRAVEPAIGGLEVGIIGAFEAVVVDDGAFSLITAAS